MKSLSFYKSGRRSLNQIDSIAPRRKMRILSSKNFNLLTFSGLCQLETTPKSENCVKRAKQNECMQVSGQVQESPILYLFVA